MEKMAFYFVFIKSRGMDAARQAKADERTASSLLREAL